MVEPRKINNGYDKRRWIDARTAYLVIAMIIGSGGTTGLTSYFTNPNIGTQVQVHNHELKIADLTATIERQIMRTENYIKSHDDEGDLKQQIVDSEFRHIRDLLSEIKSDIKSIKNGPR